MSEQLTIDTHKHEKYSNETLIYMTMI